MVLLRTIQHGNAGSGWGKVMNYEQEIAEAAYPAIRLFQVKKNTSLAPLKEVESTWEAGRNAHPLRCPSSPHWLISMPVR